MPDEAKRRKQAALNKRLEAQRVADSTKVDTRPILVMPAQPAPRRPRMRPDPPRPDRIASMVEFVRDLLSRPDSKPFSGAFEKNILKNIDLLAGTPTEGAGYDARGRGLQSPRRGIEDIFRKVPLKSASPATAAKLEVRRLIAEHRARYGNVGYSPTRKTK